MQMRRSLVGTAVFLASSSVFSEFSVSVHRQTGFTQGCPTRKLVRILCVALIQRNDTLSMVNVTDSVVDGFHIVGLVCKEGAFLNRQIFVGFLENVQCNRGIGNIFKKRSYVQ